MSETHKYRGLVIEIWRDDYAENPRQWCNMGTLALTESAWADVTISGQADLFTKLLAMEDYATWEPEYQDYDYYNVDENKARRKLEENYIILPVYKYDHGGVCYNTSGFSCPWDSDDEYMMDEARREVDYHLKNKWKERIEQLKTFIRNGVPLSTRLELL